MFGFHQNAQSMRFIPPLVVLLVYTAISLLSLNHYYFWDNVQLTSKEAHWFYQNGFRSFLLPGFSEGSEIVGTGIHPPLQGVITALLWKVFGVHLWVSHVYIAIWAVVLIYNTYRLLSHFLPQSIKGYALMVVLLEPTILAQLSIASPDIILLTALVISIRAIKEQRPWLLAFSMLFLILISARGMLTGGIVLIYYIVHRIKHDGHKLSLGLALRSFIPFAPAVVLAGLFVGASLHANGWFLSNPDSPWDQGYRPPEGIEGVVKNLAAFALRLLENGRFIIGLAGLYVIWVMHRETRLRNFMLGSQMPLVVLVLLLFLLYLYFAVTTRVAILTRYYMPIFFTFTLLVYIALSQLATLRRIRVFTLIALLMLLTGHLWVYPHRIAKAWDSTLAHWPFYQLRDSSLNYIESKGIDFNQVSSGFCFKGNQRFIDLKDRDLYISGNPSNKYFIYSNISNLSDELICSFNDSLSWRELRTFRRGMVFVSVLENQRYMEGQ